MLTADDKRTYCRMRGYSDLYAEYWAWHPMCEACGMRESAPPHHIRTRGAHGAIDDAWDLLGLCVICHQDIEQLGWRRFCELWPRLREKIEAARAMPMKTKER